MSGIKAPGMGLTNISVPPDGTWCTAPLGTSMPGTTVKDSMFIDPWPLGWVAISQGGLDLEATSVHIRAPGMYNYSWVVRGWRDPGRSMGLGSGLILPPPLLLPSNYPDMSGRLVMLAWESLDHRTRFIASEARVYDGMAELLNATTPYEIYFAGTATGLAAGLPPMPVTPEPVKETGAIRAWRKWNILVGDDGDTIQFGSIVYHHDWTAGWNQAGEYSRSRDGRGGFYAVKYFNDLIEQEPSGFLSWLKGQIAFGTVLYKGRMRRGTRGVRGRTCKPESLVLTGDMDTDHRFILLAEKYGMSLIAHAGAAARLEVGLIPYAEDDDVK